MSLWNLEGAQIGWRSSVGSITPAGVRGRLAGKAREKSTYVTGHEPIPFLSS